MIFVRMALHLQHPVTGRVTARYEAKRNNVPFFKCEQREQETREGNTSQGLRRLTYGDGPPSQPPQAAASDLLNKRVDQRGALASTHTHLEEPGRSSRTLCRSPERHPGSSQYTAGSLHSQYHRPEGHRIHMPPASPSQNWSE